MHEPRIGRGPDAHVAPGHAANHELGVRREARHGRRRAVRVRRLRLSGDGVLADQLPVEGVDEDQLGHGAHQQVLPARAELHEADQQVAAPEVWGEVEGGELALGVVPRVEEVDLGLPDARGEDESPLVEACARRTLAVDLRDGSVLPQVPEQHRLVLRARQEHVLIRMRAHGRRGGRVAPEEAQVLVLVEVPVLEGVVRLVPGRGHSAILVVVQELDEANPVLLAAKVLRSLRLLAGVDVDAVVDPRRHQIHAVVGEVHAADRPLVVAVHLADGETLDQGVRELHRPICLRCCRRHPNPMHGGCRSSDGAEQARHRP
mmetsp:Transcript_84504/g.182126  ORF Transcript_84504/g.182126 Transcript_84504/m.182126 type:complete len:318 (-) Transcript_84504:62-1015(-)